MNQSKIKSNNFTPLRPLKTAVLFLVFNRLDTTKKVFEAIISTEHRDQVMQAVLDYFNRHE